jgi:hypothetical protein
LSFDHRILVRLLSRLHVGSLRPPTASVAGLWEELELARRWLALSLSRRPAAENDGSFAVAMPDGTKGYAKPRKPEEQRARRKFRANTDAKGRLA